MTYGRFLIYPHEVLRLDCREPLRIQSEQGQLWITVGDEGVDHYLLPGQQLSCRRGRILIEGAGIVAIAASRPGSTNPSKPGLPFDNLALITPATPNHPKL